MDEQPVLSRPDARTGRGKAAATLLPFLLVAAIYAAVAGYQIELPGVYMDAVNPDYLAARLLAANKDNIPIWVLPGNDVLDRFPVLTSLYHGTLQLWLGLPIFGLFGMSVMSLRIAHALFALSVLAAFYLVLVRARLAPWMAAVVAVALAIDPSFVYSFRTQSFITMAPAAWLLLSVAALQRRALTQQGSAAWVFVSGLFAGVSIFGYFVYAFYLPALALAVMQWRAGHELVTVGARAHILLRWIGGLALGCLFYFVGYGLIANALSGVGGLKDYILQIQAELGVFVAQASLWDRLHGEWTFIESVFYNWWHDSLMFGDYTPVPAAPWKTAVLLCLPVALWALAELRHRSGALLRLLLGLEASFCAIALIFGSRLGGHHFVSLLPLSYAALAVAISAMPMPYAAGGQRAAGIGLVSAVAFLAVVNTLGDVHVASGLKKTHGVGLYSDVINRFAEDLLRDGRDELLFTPDWGLFMPVAFLTHGEIKLATDLVVEVARDTLCSGRPVMVALVDGDRAARFAQWQREVGVSPSSTRQYRQFDGKVVFEVATYRRDDSLHCGTGVTTKP